MSYLKRLVGFLSRKIASRRKFLDFYPKDISEILQICGDLPKAKTLRFWLDPNILYMHGAFCYGDGWHPFIEALREGESALEVFYRQFQPRTISEMFFLPEASGSKSYLPPWHVVWFSERDISPPIAEKGLTIEQGISYYGPASSLKIEVELERLNSTVQSVSRSGYEPEIHGDINGTFLRRGSELRFFVRGGKHRAAVLSYLGFKKIPVVIREGWEPVIDRSAANTWFLVKSGQISKILATEIFDRYFEFNGSEQKKLMEI